MKPHELDPRTFTFASKSTPGMTYTTLAMGSVLSCNCPGFTKHKERKPCTHMKQVALQLGITMDSITPPPPPETPSLFGDPMAGFVDPMLASPMHEKHTIEDYMVDDYTMEEKFDGHRLILRRDGDVISAWSRAGNVRALPQHIIDGCRFIPHGTYDGELMVPGGTSTDVTDLTKLKRLVYVAFDVLTVGEDHASTLHLNGHERRELLQLAFSKAWTGFGSVMMAQRYPVSREMLDRIWKQGGEGVIIKALKAVYAPGKRSKEWIKMKKLQSAIVTVIGFEPGKLGPHSRIIARDQHNVEVRVKSLNDAWRADFAVNSERYVGRHLAIEFQEKTKDGKYRHPMADHWVEP